MSKYHSSSHTTYNIGYHVVFCPKYRYNLLRRACANMLGELLQEKASDLGITIQTMEVMPDHVHLFVVATPTTPIERIVKQLKGYSSYNLRRCFTYLRKYPSLWTRSYFAESVGHISEKTVVKYIASQKSKTLSSPG